MKKVEIDDFARIRKLSDLNLSPSTKKAAFVVSEGDLEKNGYNTDIYVYDSSHNPTLFRLTSSKNARSPLFLDEETVLFISNREKKDSVLPETVYQKISLRGGEATEAFRLPFPASSLKPLGDDKYLVSGIHDLSLPEDEDEAKKYIEENKDYEVFDELPFWFNGAGIINKKRSGLYLYDDVLKKTSLLTDKYFDLDGFSLDADNGKVVYWGNRFESLNTHKHDLYIMNLETMHVDKVNLHNEYTVHFAEFVNDTVIFAASDGKKYGSSQNPAFFIVNKDLSFAPFLDLDPSLLAIGSDIAGGGSSVHGGDALYFLQNIGYTSCYRKLTPDGEVITVVDDIPCVSMAQGYQDFYFIGMEKDKPQELYFKHHGITEKLSSFNSDYLDTHSVARTEHFTFTDKDGVEIDGWVLLPDDFVQNKSYPAILDVHGGPQVAYGEGFFHEMQYWAGLGYIVFFCNPRGSSGKGGAFADIYGDNYGVRDYNDLMEFTDEVLKRFPQIDAKRVAMTGGSYGGFMANWIIGHTDRFAAVASQRSISNYLSKCLTTDIGYYHNLSAIQADPWTSMEKMWKHSPLAYADKAKTPTLFIQSDEDYRCWMGDAVQMLQALLMHGVPARMCLFHGENHELSRSGKPVHRIRRLKEITDWFDHYCNRK